MKGCDLMKKRIVLAMVAVMGIFAISPLSDAVNNKGEDIMYAQPAKQVISSSIDEETIVENDSIAENKEADIVEEDVSIDARKNQDVGLVKNRDTVINEVAPKSEQTPVKDNDKKDVAIQENQVNQSLDKEEALNLLKEKGSNLDYSYMGDEKDYSVLKEKGHEGYVFLPETNTDMGLFVDKNTKEVYYFHPSGYIDQY